MASNSTDSSLAQSIRPVAKVLVATTAMLAFISYWRAAAVVLNDLGSSAFYAGAIAEHFVGKTAPWFVLAIMLFAFAVQLLYYESCGSRLSHADTAPHRSVPTRPCPARRP